MRAKSTFFRAYRRIERSQQELYRLKFVHVARPVNVSKTEKNEREIDVDCCSVPINLLTLLPCKNIL